MLARSYTAISAPGEPCRRIIADNQIPHPADLIPLFDYPHPRGVSVHRAFIGGCNLTWKGQEDESRTTLQV